MGVQEVRRMKNASRDRAMAGGVDDVVHLRTYETRDNTIKVCETSRGIKETETESVKRGPI